MALSYGKESTVNSYGDCVHCGGAVEERTERLDYRYHGQLFIVENVPVGVCGQCGEKFLTAATAKRLEERLRSPQPMAAVAIPVLRY